MPGPVRLVPRRPAFSPAALRRLARRPMPHWLTTAALAVGSALVVARLTGDAAAAEQRWGERRPVVVVAAGVEAGGPVTAAVLELRRLPDAVLPTTALDRMPRGGFAAVDLAPGQVLTAALVRGAGSPSAARLPRGTRGIAVPNDGRLAVRAGDRVDVLATFDGVTEPGSPPTFPVARRALVLSGGRDTVTIAVTSHEAPRLAYALATARLTLALTS